MRKASWMARLVVGMLFSTALLADDRESPGNWDEQHPAIAISAEELIAQSQYASRWQLHHLVSDTTYSVSWQQQLADFNFQDETALERMSRLRAVSLLTIAEFGATRLFFGINHDGLVGIHFNPLPRSNDKRGLEIVRMPYLDDKETETEVENLRADSN